MDIEQVKKIADSIDGLADLIAAAILDLHKCKAMVVDDVMLPMGNTTPKTQERRTGNGRGQ